MWNGNRATRRLGIRYPIIQGPFGGGLSTVKLASTVSNAGGLGSYGAHMLSPDEIHATITDIRSATDAPFAINLWVSDHDEGARVMTQADFEAGMKVFEPIYKELGIPPPPFTKQDAWGYNEQVGAILDARPPIFSFVFGIPAPEILAECRQRNIVTIGAATTVAEALAIQAAGVDMVVATGFEAGGHRPSFLKSPEKSLMGTFALVPQVVDSVKCPVIAAGGISDVRGVAAAFALGAEAVQLGTAFLACEESGTSPLHRDLMGGERARETTLSRAFTGRLARFIRNRFIERAELGDLPSWPFPFQSWFVGFIKRAATEQGNPEYMPLYAGQAASLLRHRKAAELLQSLVPALSRL